MFLCLWLGISFYFYFQDTLCLMLGRRYHFFCPDYGKHTDNKTNYHYRSNHPVIADAARFHGNDLTASGEFAKSHQRCQ